MRQSISCRALRESGTVNGGVSEIGMFHRCAVGKARGRVEANDGTRTDTSGIDAGLATSALVEDAHEDPLLIMRRVIAIEEAAALR